jgi:hypothetical protein
MGSFERFTTKTHFNSLKRQVVLAALAMFATKLVVAALGASPGGSWLDLLARLPPGIADLGAALLVFEVLRTRRAANRAARSAVLVAASPVLFVASGVHGDPAGVAVCLLLLGMYLLVDREAPLAAGIAVGVAARVDPLVLVAAPVALALLVPRRARGADAAGGRAGGRGRRGPFGRARTLPTGPARRLAARPDRRQLAAGDGGARTRLLHFVGALGAALLAGWAPALGWGWRAREAVPEAGGPGGLGPGWLLARPLDEGLPGLLLGAGRPLVVAAAVVPAVLWVRRRPDRAYAAVGLALLGPLALAPAFTPRELVWPVVFGYLGDARWASIYAAVAGATLLWTSAWWGPGPPWDGGVAPEVVPAAGRGAALGFATWVVLAAWAGIGWRTVAVESRPPRGRERRSAAERPPVATAPEPAAAAPEEPAATTPGPAAAPTQALAPPGGS